MAKYRKSLPQLSDNVFLATSGIDTTPIHLDRWESPIFAPSDLHKSGVGSGELRDYYIRYASLADRFGFSFVLESPTWYANPDWANTVGFSAAQLTRVNQEAIELVAGLRGVFDTDRSPIVVSGCVGPRRDGYDSRATMTAAEAADYHAFQTEVFADSEADMATAITMNYVDEAVGFALAAAAIGLPSAISFTLDPSGHLPTGQPLADAIAEVDDATGDSPVYYMINCTHPTDFDHVLTAATACQNRIRGVRSTVSKLTVGVDKMTESDCRSPIDMTGQYSVLRQRLRNLNVLGSCSGDDLHRLSRAIH